jgi:hypothetical protein
MKLHKVPQMKHDLRGTRVNNLYARDVFLHGSYGMGHRGNTLTYLYYVNMKRKIHDLWKKVYRTDKCRVPWWGDES